jgi:hypothetical protein
VWGITGGTGEGNPHGEVGRAAIEGGIEGGVEGGVGGPAWGMPEGAFPFRRCAPLSGTLDR